MSEHDVVTGDDISLSLQIYLLRTAFINPNIDALPPSLPAASTSTTPSTSLKLQPPPSSSATPKAPSFSDSLLETSSEKSLRERKKALNTLFDKINLVALQLDPETGAPVTGNGGGAGSQSRRTMLERLEKSRGRKGGLEEVDLEEEEEELNEVQLHTVCTSSRFPSSPSPFLSHY